MKTENEFLEELKQDLSTKAGLYEAVKKQVGFKELYESRIRLFNYVIRQIEQFQVEKNNSKCGIDACENNASAPNRFCIDCANEMLIIIERTTAGE